MIESENIFGKLQADDDNECPTSHCSCLICKIAAVLPPFFNEPELKNLVKKFNLHFPSGFSSSFPHFLDTKLNFE